MEVNLAGDLLAAASGNTENDIVVEDGNKTNGM